MPYLNFWASARAAHPLSLQGLRILLLSAVLVLCTDFAYSGSVVSNRDGQAFSPETVRELACELAQEPFKDAEKTPKSLTQMDYSTYRKINFRQDAAIWGDSRTRFSVQLFAPGFLFKDLVEIHVVENGLAYPVRVSESSFRVPDEALGKILAQVGKYAGFRLHYPINRNDYEDEFIVFQGASYFRAVSKGQAYGLSARGLAIDVAQPDGEEYPLFKRFWIERPSIHQKSIVVHALLDSQSVSGAYRFTIYPGSVTRVDVHAVLFPRRDVQHVGLAPLTSMFMHGPMDEPDRPDYRPAVHDSEALAMTRGNGERIWRPLNNPPVIQTSAFLDENPGGFGLIQRHRRFDYYQDLEAQYHRRPSAWVESLGDWGQGWLELVEIPSEIEANDNIVAYWRLAKGLEKGRPFSYSYRITWPADKTLTDTGVRIVRSAAGEKVFADNREIVIDYSQLSAQEIKGIRIDCSISPGRILEKRIEPNPNISGARVFVGFDPGQADVSELRVQLKKDGEPVAATWLHRWVNQDQLK